VIAFAVGEVISYQQMCLEEGASLQAGMNFRLRGGESVVLMSRRSNAPYTDRVLDDGTSLIYEGHDAPRGTSTPSPKAVDQPDRLPSGRLTQNGLFAAAAARARLGGEAERVRVYEKLYPGVWVFNGTFDLTDAWREAAEGRLVFKFRLELSSESEQGGPRRVPEPEHDRIIPSDVKLAVWKRDRGRCVLCQRTDNLHFDHVIPYSRGGSSRVAENIQILCARHNLEKRDRIE
jgi:hypothetical protein